MQITCVRVRMALGSDVAPHCSYEARVHVSELHAWQCKAITHWIVSDGAEYVTLADAIAPQDHWTMPLGWERWEAWKAIDARAKELGQRAIHKAFPETQGHAIRDLWQPSPDVGHKTVIVEVTP